MKINFHPNEYKAKYVFYWILIRYFLNIPISFLLYLIFGFKTTNEFDGLVTLVLTFVFLRQFFLWLKDRYGRVSFLGWIVIILSFIPLVDLLLFIICLFIKPRYDQEKIFKSQDNDFDEIQNNNLKKLTDREFYQQKKLDIDEIELPKKEEYFKSKNLNLEQPPRSNKGLIIFFGVCGLLIMFIGLIVLPTQKAEEEREVQSQLLEMQEEQFKTQRIQETSNDISYDSCVRKRRDYLQTRNMSEESRIIYCAGKYK